MTACGTKLPIRNVRSPVANEGKADKHLLVLSITGFALFRRADRPSMSMPAYAQRVRTLTHLCHSMSNLAALHSSVLAQRCGNVRLPA